MIDLLQVKATGPDCEGCLDTLAVLQKAAEDGMELSQLWSIPEQDSWQVGLIRCCPSDES